VAYLLVYHVVGYRKKIVFSNISNAFPLFTPADVTRTAKRFYHHLCDVVLESAVMHFLSEKQACERFRYRNPELLNEIYDSGKLVMAVAGHYGNWEYFSTLSLPSHYPGVAIYKPLRNKYYDRMVKGTRTRFGMEVTPMEKIARLLIGYHQAGKPVMTLFLSDQRPMFHQIQYWTTFLNQDTPLYLGTEKLARKLNAAVVFLNTRKIKRGRYEVEIVPVCLDPGQSEPFEITESHVRILEDLIREEPGYWLWSHRRWKHSREKYEAKHSGR
jgi:KDO2-lipid IV(A) lauroyltransferase